MQVSELYVYPVKSCRGLSLTEAHVTRMGIRFDRQWMIVDERGVFVAQRGGDSGVGVRSMCLIETAMAHDMLIMSAPGMPELSLPLHGLDGPRRAVQVWKSRTVGIDQGEAASQWVSSYLSRERPGHYRVVRMADGERRVAKTGESTLAFADGYPFLVLSEASLADLNSRLAAPLPMNRFRPNVVLKGCAPYEEDRLDRFGINGIEFHGMSLCPRCPITTTDQKTGERSLEPLRTLATYRRSGAGVVFARNFNHRGVGHIKLGDPVIPQERSRA